MTIIQRSLGRLSATTLVALLLTVLLAPGCTKERPSVEDPAETPGYTTDDWEGSTYMSLALRTTPPTTDPATQQEAGAKDGKESPTGEESFTIWQGDDIIDNFAVYIVSEGIDKVQPIAGPVSGNTDVTWDPVKQELLLKPFPTAPVSKRIFAFFNIPEQYQKYLDEKLSNKKEFLERISEPIPYMGEKGITYDQDAPLLEAFRPDSHIATKVIKSEQMELLNSMSKVGRGLDEEKPWYEVDFPNEFFDEVTPKNTKQGELNFNKRSDRIFASGERYNYLPEDYITKEEVEKDGRNLVQVYTRRVLAQAVVTVEGSLVERPNYSGLQGMHIVGLSFQVLNFDPTFYPIAKTTKEGDWPGNSNTTSPLYDKSDNSSRVNLSNYKWSYKDETFDLETLITDRYFRSAHFVYDLPSLKELKQDDPEYAQKLMREREISDNREVDGVRVGETSGLIAPKHTTTFWGSCYVTESTQKWGTDAYSGYTTSNTPFFAVVASFDTETLPWGDNTIAIAKAKIDNKQKDLDDALKAWREELAAKEAELADIPEGGGGGMSEADADAIFAAYKKWLNTHVKNGVEKGTMGRAFNNISKKRDEFKAKTIDEAEYLKKIKRNRNNLRDNLQGATSGDEEAEFNKTLEADKKLIAGDPYAEQRKQLNSEIAALNKKIEDFTKEFNSSGDKYPKDVNSGNNLEFYTQFIYDQGINRIFYSQADNKFYLNYHEIPFAKRGGQRHTLTENDPWLDDMKSKLPNGKKFPTEANGAPATAAVLPPSADLMSRLSQLLNGEIKETDLSPAERRSMDFYLYGRVAPGLVKYFGGNERIDRIDLQSGYVAWYSTKGPDQVVSYPCYVRNKAVDRDGTEIRSSISKPRLMMVYYAWLNPNTSDPTNSYASPVLRNNIYHMHITGFTKVGLSAIPFVPRVPEGNGYKFLHAPLDPDEVVPAPNAKLNAIGGSTGQPAGITASSSRYTVTF
ncbi:fimbria major subunit [uncultured Porphyromonas sp.]|uniref:fimbria major subunit n=1 Tax=uncultured Porphyromonas sp. TaxID=159274 RepID=UPI0025F6C767|nr:fimbria major subunit [uncultured Porphyromonas sp.]